MSFRSKPLACRDCPAYEWGRGFVEFEGPRDATFCFLGQGPGESEAHRSRPFDPTAPSGEHLTYQWIYRSHLQRNDVMIGNVVQCWLPEKVVKGIAKGNRYPTLDEVRFCWQAHVGPVLHEWALQPGPRHLLPVGVPAIKWILQLPWDKGAERYAGTSTEVNLPRLETSDGASHL